MGWWYSLYFITYIYALCVFFLICNTEAFFWISHSIFKNLTADHSFNLLLFILLLVRPNSLPYLFYRWLPFQWTFRAFILDTLQQVNKYIVLYVYYDNWNFLHFVCLFINMQIIYSNYSTFSLIISFIPSNFKESFPNSRGQIKLIFPILSILSGFTYCS